MLLTISTTHAPATDLGYVLDVDPVGLVRGKGGSGGAPLQQYVNDRPYVASALLSVALSELFSTAMGGRSKDRPALAAMERSGLWEQLKTDWVCLDAELLPWSAKAKDLLLQQYAAVGASGEAALTASLQALQRATDRGLAPFHLLASEGAVHTDKSHRWHMETLVQLARADEGLLMATPHLVVDLQDEAAEAAAAQWWEDLTGRGGEGMVIKPMDFIARSERGTVIQPAVKCRGREYLRIIYGPEYTEPEHLDRLRARGLSVKRGLALREFALGLEALTRFVGGEPLRRVHECLFGVLALESEAVDPRL